MGVYRFWRDLGYALGALGAGLVADALGIYQAFSVFALLMMLAAITFALRSRDDTSDTVQPSANNANLQRDPAHGVQVGLD